MKYARYIILATLVLLQAIFGVPDIFIGRYPYWTCSMAYSFFHANWFHLAVNGIAILSVYKNSCKPCRDFVIPYIIAVIVYPLSFRPVIGFSNVLYATIGMRTPSLRSKWWRQQSVIVFLVITIALMFIPQFSATTHIAAFILGMGCAALRRGYLELTKDARRYL